MKLVASLLLLLVTALPALAQRKGPFNLTAQNQCATVDVNSQNASTVGISVTGTWSATLQPEVQIAKQTAANTVVYPAGSTTSQGTITANGVYVAAVGGYDLFEICVSAYTSGTAVVYVNVSTGISTQFFSGGGGGSGTVTSVSVTTANGVSGTVATATTTPAITVTLGAITPSSIAATGIVDGRAPVTITTASTATLGGTFQSGYTLNQEATAGTAVTYTLPVAAAGKQYCIKNSYNGSAGTTGILTLITSATGQFMIYNGAVSATHGQIVSGGALGDAVCAVGIDATHWEIYTQQGTWTLT